MQVRRRAAHLADAGYGAQPVEGLHVVLLGMAHDVELEVADEPVVVIDQQQIDLDALLHAWLREAGR